MPKEDVMAKRIHGVNDTPPRRGTEPLCILRSFGMSNKEYLFAITNTLGIKNIAKIIEIKNDNGTHK